MVLALIPNPGHWYQHLTFNWFDVALVLVLAFGFWRGRKRGMTRELLPTLQWVSILLGAGFGHIFLADWMQQQGLVKMVFGNHFDERTTALMSAYLAILLVLMIVFTTLKRKYEPKLEGSSLFGDNEYYWGIAASLVRYLCLILVALALLNAPYYTEKDILAQQAYNNRWFGGGLKNYRGDYFPPVYEVQDNIFKQSFLGPFIKSGFSMLLINSTPAVKPPAQI